MHVHTASQLSPLLAHLAEQLRSAPLPPRESEIIVVQSQGMRRWVTLQLADRFGCAGSMLLPFPTAFVRDVEQRLSPDRSARNETDSFTRELLAWRLDAMLRALPEQPVFDPLHRYLRGTDDRARFGLASQIAARFDDYQLFRADLLRDWESGRDTPGTSHSAWQAALWRDLCTDPNIAGSHLAARLHRTINAIQTGQSLSLPSRVTVFGVSALPPVFIELLAALAKHVEVTVYTATLPDIVQHPVAAALGMQGREFLDLLASHGATISALTSDGSADRSPASEANTLLATLQHELATGATGQTPLTLRPDDASLRVHNAHGRTRQLEIIRDQLLDALNADPSLRPHDLLLLVPDATDWAPLVDAVFGNAAEPGAHIPYRIADRPTRRAQPAADAFGRLLALEGGRLARSEVFGLLSVPIARQGAELTAGDVDSLEALTHRANVRWGYDAAARSALGLPAYEDASWRAGLDRLLLGVAVGQTSYEVLDLLPESGDTAGDPEILARLATWVDTLADTFADWRTPRTLGDWSDTLIATAERLLSAQTPVERQSLESLSATLHRLRTVSELARYEPVVPFGVVRDWLENLLDDDSLGAGFLVGGMTVAALKPMRSLPFRVIAVAGLDDGVFPRRERRAAFDLLEHERRPGDRDLRTDDRQLFLDILLAAQERLILSFNGRAVRDNTPCAPSVVLDELLDHLDKRTGGSARKQVVVVHPLQPFAPTYFAAESDAQLFTFSRTFAEAASANAARAAADGARTDDSTSDDDEPFVTAPIDPQQGSDANLHLITLRDLTDCWENPSRFFCKHTLRLVLAGDLEDIPDDEPFALDPMRQGGVKAKLLAASLASPECTRDDAIAQTRLVANGDLPLGELGAAWYTKLGAVVDNVLAGVPRHEAHTVPVDLHGGEGTDAWRLVGRLDQARGDTRYVVRAGSIRAEHRIRTWIEHVVLCAVHEQDDTGVPTSTILMGVKGVDLHLGPVRNAGALLDALVRTAVQARSAPLPFFAQAGWAYHDATLPPKKKSKKAKKPPFFSAVDAFRKQSDMFNAMGGDNEDPYVALCFRGSDPITADWAQFEELTQRLFSGWPQVGGDA